MNRPKIALFKSMTTICLGHMLMDFMLGIWPAFKTLAKLDLSKAGLIAGSGMFIGEGLQLFFGYFSDRGFAKFFMILGLMLVGLVAFLGEGYSYLLLFAIVLCSYIGSSAFHPAAIGAIDSLGNRRKSFLVTLFFAGGTFGAVFSQTIFSQTYRLLNGQTWVFFIPAFILAVFLGFQSFPHSQKQSSSQFDFYKIKSAIIPQIKPLLLLLSVQVLVLTTLLSVMFLLPDLLISRGHPDWYCLGGANSCFVMGTAIFSVPAGLLADRFGYRRVLLASALFSCAFLYTFLSAGTSGLAFQAVLLFGLGGSLGVANPIIVSAGCQLVPKSCCSLISGILMGFGACLASLGVMAAGFLVTCFTYNAPEMALACMGSLLFSVCLMSAFLPNPGSFQVAVEAVEPAF